MKTLSTSDVTQTFADDIISGPGVVPQCLLPSQSDHGSPSVAVRNPEARLMLAVLDDAIAALARTRRGLSAADRQERVELEEWFSSEDRSELYAFESICASELTALTLRTEGSTRALFGQAVTANYFETFRVAPAAGRLFGAEVERDAVSAAVIVIVVTF